MGNEEKKKKVSKVGQGMLFGIILGVILAVVIFPENIFGYGIIGICLVFGLIIGQAWENKTKSENKTE